MFAGNAPKPAWRELHRTQDSREAMTVLTTIAAMEFEVRFAGGLSHAEDSTGDDGAAPLGPPPHIIEVRAEEWPDLRGVLDSILDEQAQFDRDYAERRDRRRKFERWMMVAITLGAILTMLLASLGCAADDRSARAHGLRLCHA